MPPALSPGTQIDRYRVEAVLGEGGMATVYRVQHAIIGQTYALKVLTSITGHLRDRVLQEGRVQGSLRHPNVVQVFDAFEVDGVPALVLEFVDGPSLADVVEKGPIAPERAERIFRDVVAGVRAAHERRLIHRDLKPANILLHGEGTAEAAKVTDFGIVKVTDEGGQRLTATGAVFGTPAYMAPEQLDSPNLVDQRTDIFALGSVLYEMLTGKPAFERATVARTFVAVSTCNYLPLPLSTPARLAAVVDNCLRLEMCERPRDCDAILAMLDGRVAARPPRAPVVADTWTDGPRAAAAGITAVVEPGAEHGSRDPSAEWAHLSLPPPENTAQWSGTLPPEPRPPAPEPPSRAWVGWAVVGAGGAAFLFVGIVALAAIYLWNRAPDATGPKPEVAAPAPPAGDAALAAEPAAGPVAPAVATMEPPTEATPEPARTSSGSTRSPSRSPAADVAAPASAAPVTAAAPTEAAPEVAPEVATPAPEPTPTAPAPARLWVSGTAARVEVRGGGKTWSPGAIPAGTYSVWADFDGSSLSKVASFSAAAGETVTVRCTAEAYECSVKER